MARPKQRTSDLAAKLRPIARTLIEEALQMYDAAKNTVAAAGEQFEDLVAQRLVLFIPCDQAHNALASFLCGIG